MGHRHYEAPATLREGPKHEPEASERDFGIGEIDRKKSTKAGTLISRPRG